MRRLRSQVHAPPNPDRWLVSYADFMTLLFAFFVVMYASSSINDDRYQVLSEALEVVFNEVPRSLDPIEVGEPLIDRSADIVDIPDASTTGHPDEGDTHIEPNEAELIERFAGFMADERLQIEANNDWIEVSIGGSLAFAQGSAALSAQGRRITASLAEYVAGLQQPVHVEGYTDNVPSRSRSYPSNWALASARAAAVAAAFESSGINRRRLSVVGYADNHPLRTNATPDGRRSNRRVVVVIARRSGVARDLNALPGSSAFAHVRQQQTNQLDERVRSRRTADGRLLFTN